MSHAEMSKIINEAKARGIHVGLVQTYLSPIIVGEGQWRLEAGEDWYEYVRGGQDEVNAACERMCDHLLKVMACQVVSE